MPSVSQECNGTMREVAWEELSDPTLDEDARGYFELVAMGWDEDHPFTTSPNEAAQRLYERRGMTVEARSPRLITRGSQALRMVKPL